MHKYCKSATVGNISDLLHDEYVNFIFLLNFLNSL